MPELTDLSYVRALCEKYDFALSKGFGQNFIINPGLPIKIVDASRVDKRYGVIEIGPGIGVLTRELAKRAAKVVSIEVDERLPPLLAAKKETKTKAPPNARVGAYLIPWHTHSGGRFGIPGIPGTPPPR